MYVIYSRPFLRGRRKRVLYYPISAQVVALGKITNLIAKFVNFSYKNYDRLYISDRLDIIIANLIGIIVKHFS